MIVIPSSFSQLVDSVKDINLSTRQQQTIGVITAAAVVTSYSLYKLWNQGPNDGCPVVPYTNPLNGSSAEFRKNPREFIQTWTEKLGPVYRVHLFGRLYTVVSGRYVREVFLNNNFDFFTGINRRFNMPLMAGIPEGEIPQEEGRKVVVKYLTPQLKYFTARAVENLNIGLKEIMGDLNEPKELPHMYPLVQRMVARASASVFVGTKLAKDDELVSVFQNITTDIGSMIRTESWLEPFASLLHFRMWAIGRFSSKVRAIRSKMTKTIGAEVERRLEAAEQNPNGWDRPVDVLQDLIENVNIPRGSDLITTIVNYTIALIFASIHTTSENGTIVLYRILQNPELMDELLEEQKEVLQRNGIDPEGAAKDVFTFEIVKDLPKLDSIVRESMRLRNEFYELPHSNVGNKKVVLSNGTVIRPGEDVLINTWYNQQYDGWDEYKVENDDRSEFKPYRYINTGRPSTKVGDDYLVFGEGKHACPGRWFAIQEIKTIISLLLRDYKVRPSSDVIFPTTTATAMPFGTATIEKRQRA
ncbi:cytochrome P450 [Zychaea mexicana]|uniref:cytochrome P450 n=1 Tax=Zychaea mexicana TaxID=64656 RepID=UPI0022FE69FB|nr:cytochrome P450 [Zychaea mexicana]KAI9495644.1 cytochrome P450 [Zychaea mexicana]